jgi:hypothetical protein
MFTKNDGTYKDGARTAGRSAHLFIVAPDGAVIEFTGTNVPKFLAITGQKYEKNGKWSNTTYQFKLGTGVRAVTVESRMHAAPFDQYGDWGAVHAALVAEIGGIVDPASLQAAIRAAYPKAAGRVDERQAALADLI